MGCPVLTERDYFKLHKCTEKTAYSRFLCTATDDQIGNREDYTTYETGSSVQSVYTTNTLNQYTAITNPSQSPTYDTDGNMLTMTLASGSWTNTFNAENRIIAQEKSDARLEYVYDYMGRRVEKKVYSGSVGNWTLDSHKRFVYDNYLQIEELDALNSNAVTNKRIWGGGKIICDIRNGVAYYALGDANKNITDYIDASGNIKAHYEYSPFGKITASSGAMKNNFDYRFSSEVFDTETGLSYYNYRYYSAGLGRWLSRDPIGDVGGPNWFILFDIYTQEMSEIYYIRSIILSNEIPYAMFMIDYLDNNERYLKNMLFLPSEIISSSNAYLFTYNAPIIFIDELGLDLEVQGSKKFKKKTKAALDKIKEKPKGKELIENLEKSKKKHVIKETKKGNSCKPCKGYKKGKRGDSEVSFNPDKKTGGVDETGSNKRPPYVGLGHELGHSEAIDKGTQDFDRGNKKKGTTPSSERNSIKREREIRKEHGLKDRKSYY